MLQGTQSKKAELPTGCMTLILLTGVAKSICWEREGHFPQINSSGVGCIGKHRNNHPAQTSIFSGNTLGSDCLPYMYNSPHKSSL